MKRMFIFSIVISFLLMIYSAVAAAPEAGTPNGKSFYSSRPNRMLRTLSEVAPTLAPVTDQVSTPANTEHSTTSPTANKLPASKLLENKTLPNKTFSEFSDFSSTVPVLAPPNQTDQPNQPELSTTEKTVEIRPLSKIDIHPMSTVKAERTEVYKKTEESSGSSGSNFISRTTLPHQPVFTEDDKNKQDVQLDELKARLAKIQLEKHNLNETLKLIDKIKSPAIKARTLVDLAEYVSRDTNYKKEAEQLYALAVDGIDALTKGEAIVIKIRENLKTESFSSSPVTNSKPSAINVFTEPKKPAESTPATSVTSTSSSRKPALTLLDEDEPIGLSTPKKESTLTESTLKASQKSEQKPDESLTETLPKTPPKVSPNVSSKTPEIPVSPSPASTVSSASTPAVKKAPILLELDDQPEKKQPLEDKVNVIEKEITSTPTPTPTKRPPILLDLDDESETPKKEKQEEVKLPSTRKPSILLTDEPSVDKEKEAEKKITELPKTETVKKDEPEILKTETKPSPSSSTTKPARRSMPGRKITLEEN